MSIFKEIRVLMFLVIVTSNTILKVNCESETGSKSGPFRAVLVKVTPCTNTTYPMEQNPSMLVHMETHGSKSLLRGNITVVREVSNIQIKLKGFNWDGSKWKLIHLMNGIGCHGMLLDLFCRAIHLQMYNRDNCTFLKGQWTFDGMDINPLQHIWTSKMEYGRMLWSSEITARKSTYSCWVFETLVERA